MNGPTPKKEPKSRMAPPPERQMSDNTAAISQIVDQQVQCRRVRVHKIYEMKNSDRIKKKNLHPQKSSCNYTLP